ncbi:MAG: serine/threonine-protein kinase [Planctomycetota bacterium]
MNAKLAERAMQIFEQVYELQVEARSAAVDQVCEGDDALRQQVNELLDNIRGVEIVELQRDDTEEEDSFFAENAGSRYELGEEIGRGGMGTVYRAMDNRLDRVVAIKVMHGTDDAEARQRFSREAKIAAGLQHPGIAPIYDSGLLPDDRPFLAMKLIEGHTLSSLLLRRTGVVDGQPRLLAAFEDLCQVIAYAHTHNIIHRDLKPDNVMAGPFGEVQVMDWGLAKWLDDQGQENSANANSPIARVSPASWPTGSRTRFGSVMGTPAYMPPEQIAGTRGKQTDVFSLGAMLCEILTGSPPYIGDSEAEVLSKSASADLHDANLRLDDCDADEELIQLARDCMHADPNQRPADGSAVAERISAYSQAVQSRLRNIEIEKARAEAMATEAGKRRRVKAMLSATAVVLLLVVLGALAWISNQQALRERDDAIRQAASLERVNQSRIEAIRFLQSAEDAALDDLIAWESAAAAIRQTQSLLDRNVPRRVANDVNALTGQITNRLADRKLLSRIERAREVALEQISVPNQPEPSRRERRYEQLARVFEATALDPRSSSHSAAQQFVRSKEPSIREALIGAIDEWFVVCDSKMERNWLAEAVHTIDENAWRKNWRQAVLQDDLPRLRELLETPATLAQSPRSVLNLSDSIKTRAPHLSTMGTLQNVYRRNVEDFWLNCALGDHAKERGQTHLAVQYYQYALGVRPLSSLHRQIGRVFLKTGWLDDARYHLERALDLNDQSRDSWEWLAVTSLKLGMLNEADAAYQKTKSLSSEEFEMAVDYVAFLQQSDQRGKAIEYLSNRKDESERLHRELINLVYLDRHYLQSIEEFERYVARYFGDPMLYVTMSDAAILASQGFGKETEDLTEDQCKELRLKAHDWLEFALANWSARLTNLPVLREIRIKRDAGNYNSVLDEDAIAELSPDEQSKWRRLWAVVSEEEKQLRSFDWSQYNRNSWTTIEPESISSKAGVDFQRLEDGSFFVQGPSEERDVYTLEQEIDLSGIHAIRLDVISDERLPENGPGRHPTGNFHLAEIELWVRDESSQSGSVQRLFDRAIASYSWQDRPVDNAIDGNPRTQWHVWGKLGHSQSAKFYLPTPLTESNGNQMTIRLVHGGNNVTAPLGRFRLSFQRVGRARATE